MKPQTILFDLDDTLVHCNKYFDIVLDQFADLLATWFASYRPTVEDIKKKQLEIDIAGVNVHGFTTDHFAESLVQTYDYFTEMSGRKPSKAEQEELRALGQSVYDRQVEPYPDMVETLDRLKAEGHTLYLYTGGIEDVQHKKIKAVELESYFGERVFVRQHKTAEALEEIVVEQGFDRKKTWMIGNSIRTDIVPALRAGLHCIYIPALLEWEYNVVEITEQPKGIFLRIASLQEVPNAIADSIKEVE